MSLFCCFAHALACKPAPHWALRATQWLALGTKQPAIFHEGVPVVRCQDEAAADLLAECFCF